MRAKFALLTFLSFASSLAWALDTMSAPPPQPNDQYHRYRPQPQYNRYYRPNQQYHSGSYVGGNVNLQRHGSHGTVGANISFGSSVHYPPPPPPRQTSIVYFDNGNTQMSYGTVYPDGGNERNECELKINSYKKFVAVASYIDVARSNAMQQCLSERSESECYKGTMSCKSIY